MAIVNQVEKKMKLSKWGVVKYQIITHCFVNDISISESDLNCLTYLAIEGPQELTDFCTKAHEKKIFMNIQSVRNCLIKAEKKKLIKKEGRYKKKIFIHPDLNISSEGTVFLNFKLLGVETEEG